MNCLRCAQDNRSGAKFCEECGAPLARVCTQCGAGLSGTAKFCGECAHPTGLLPSETARTLTSSKANTPKRLVEKILTSKASLEGERKQVTVLFADLKGSMELLADRDPEEARKILDPVLERMMESVHRYEGTVNQVMGDGIMALFGAPLAHEDHALRACYAALRMQEAVKVYAEEVRRSYAATVKIRVGLNSGEVVVRSIGSDLNMDYTAIGQTTHLAARMEQLADPGAIVITPDTLALVEGYVEVGSLGPVPIKGLASPLEVYQVKSAGAVRTRLQASARRGLTRFIGRDTEMEQLLRAQRQVDEGRGQVVAIVGEAGVGKSRLVYELVHSHRVQGWLTLESASVSYGKATSWLPAIELLKSYFKVHDRDDHRQIREKVIGKLLALDESLKLSLPALLNLLDVRVTDTSWETLDPAQRRRRTIDAVKHLLLREAREQPLLVIFEDLHWIDGETQALLDSLVERLASARLLLLVNYRPEYKHDWVSRTSYRQINLDALRTESATELLEVLLGDDPGLLQLKELLVQRGNPFFMEETVRTLAETKALAGEIGNYRLARPIQSIQVPPTVHAMLAARIDRLLPHDKRLLQVASVIGKDVPFSVLQAIADLDDDALRRRLDRLQSAEFLYEAGLFPDLEYTFKHALTHEVTYSGVLQEHRRELHARIVLAMESLWPNRLGEQSERLSEHAMRGGLWEKALIYLERAARKAYDLSAHRQAVVFRESALACIDHLPSSRTLTEMGIDVRIRLRNSLTQLGDKTRQLHHLRQAEQLAEESGDQHRLTQVNSLLANYFLTTGDMKQAVASGQRALILANELDDLDVRVMVNVHMGQIDHAIGDFRGGAERLQENICAIRPEREQDFFNLALPASILSRAFRIPCLADLGDFNEAIALGQEAVRLAEKFDRTLDRVYAFRALAYAYLRIGDFDSALPIVERGLELCLAGNFSSLWLAFAAMLTQMRARRNQFKEALTLLEECRKSSHFMQSLWHVMLGIEMGDAYLQIGQVDDAERIARQTLEISQHQRGRGSEAGARRLLGEVVANRDSAQLETAMSHYQQALTVAKELGMRPLIAHCHLGLGKVLAKTEQIEQARDHLTNASTLFQSMSMQYWLKQVHVDMSLPRPLE